MKKDSSPSLADYLVERKKIKQEFFTQINTLIDWRVISNIIVKLSTSKLSGSFDFNIPSAMGEQQIFPKQPIKIFRYQKSTFYLSHQHKF